MKKEEMQKLVNNHYDEERMKMESLYREIESNVEEVLQNVDVRISSYLKELYHKTNDPNEEINFMFLALIEDIRLILHENIEKTKNVYNCERALHDINIFLSEKNMNLL